MPEDAEGVRGQLSGQTQVLKATCQPSGFRILWTEPDTWWTEAGERCCQKQLHFCVFSAVRCGSGDPAARRIQQSWYLPSVSARVHSAPLCNVQMHELKTFLALYMTSRVAVLRHDLTIHPSIHGKAAWLVGFRMKTLPFVNTLAVTDVR